MTDDLERARERRRRACQRVGAFGPSGRKQVVINRVMARVDAAAERHDPAAYYAGKAPTPERITIALDYRELYGPEVDRALGGEEPMVDEWESGARARPQLAWPRSRTCGAGGTAPAGSSPARGAAASPRS